MADGERLRQVVGPDAVGLGGGARAARGQDIVRSQSVGDLGVHPACDIAPKNALFFAQLIIQPDGNLQPVLMQRGARCHSSAGIGGLGKSFGDIDGCRT